MLATAPLLYIYICSSQQPRANCNYYLFHFIDQKNNWGTERFHDSPKLTQLVNCGAEFPSSAQAASRVQAQTHWTAFYDTDWNLQDQPISRN